MEALLQVPGHGRAEGRLQSYDLVSLPPANLIVSFASCPCFWTLRMSSLALTLSRARDRQSLRCRVLYDLWIEVEAV